MAADEVLGVAEVHEADRASLSRRGSMAALIRGATILRSDSCSRHAGDHAVRDAKLNQRLVVGQCPGDGLPSRTSGSATSSGAVRHCHAVDGTDGRNRHQHRDQGLDACLHLIAFPLPRIALGWTLALHYAALEFGSPLLFDLVAEHDLTSSLRSPRAETLARIMIRHLRIWSSAIGRLFVAGSEAIRVEIAMHADAVFHGARCLAVGRFVHVLARPGMIPIAPLVVP